MNTSPLIDVLWEDNTTMVVAKPAALLSTGAPGIETLETRLREFLRARAGEQGSAAQPYATLVHRLDRPVSGAVLVARNVRTAQRLGDQFQTRKIRKRYLAAVQGQLAEPSGTWVDTMRKIPDRPLAERVPAEHPQAKRAVLHYRVLDHDEQTTLLEIELETGRMHQIRLQAASRGHAVLGDWLYGSQRAFGPTTDDPRKKVIALHGQSITFRHPKTAVQTTVAAPLPQDWQTLTHLTILRGETGRGYE